MACCFSALSCSTRPGPSLGAASVSPEHGTWALCPLGCCDTRGRQRVRGLEAWPCPLPLRLAHAEELPACSRVRLPLIPSPPCSPCTGSSCTSLLCAGFIPLPRFPRPLQIVNLQGPTPFPIPQMSGELKA